MSCLSGLGLLQLGQSLPKDCQSSVAITELGAVLCLLDNQPGRYVAYANTGLRAQAVVPFVGADGIDLQGSC